MQGTNGNDRRGFALVTVVTLALVACLTAIATSPAAAAESPPYTLDPQLSLTGDCSTSKIDPTPDPSCPYGAPPAGPTGRFRNAKDVAIDAYGNEYVASNGGSETSEGRIDVFDDDGHFITELADPNRPNSIAVDSEGNLYVFEVGSSRGEAVRYTPSVYKPEEGKIAYGNPRVVIEANPQTVTEGSLAIDLSNDRLYVSWWNTFISEYGSKAEGNALLGTITHPDLYSNKRVAVDGQRRRIYASSCEADYKHCVVLVFDADAPHALLEEVDGSSTPQGEFVSQAGSLSLAVDEESGDFLVGDLQLKTNVFVFGEDYDYRSKFQIPESQFDVVGIEVSNSPLNPAAANLGYAFVPRAQFAGNAFAFKPPGATPPTVESVAASQIAETEAELEATIDPGVDPLGADTEYRFEYVSAEQYAIDEFDSAAVAGGGALASASPAERVSAFAEGLAPGQEYRFRAVAENEGGEDEAGGSFTTYDDAGITHTCPNEALRSGASAALPDCRAYELTTPPDTNGNPTKGAGIEGDRFGMQQSSPSGNTISFQLLGGALPGTDATGGVYGAPYRATRGASGWSTELAGPTSAQTTSPNPGDFSPEQSYNFWTAFGAGSAVVGGNLTHYLRYPDGHSELIGRGSEGTDPRAEGRLITEGATHVVFQTETALGVPQQLEPNAPPDGIRAVYDRTRDPVTGAEQTHVVSLLPGDVTPGTDSFYLNASADGDGIAFTNGGTLYLRVGNQTTYEIGSGVEFAGVSEGGGRIFYVEGGDLFAFDTAIEATIPFSEVGDATPVNVARDGTRAYFASEEAIAGSGPNPNGAEPQAGDQNLYLSEEGDVSFVGTVTDRDMEGREDTAVGQIDGLGLWTRSLAGRTPGFDPSRLTADGSVFLFQSRADLDDFQPGEEPQIYRYDVAADLLGCVSCPPTKATGGDGADLMSFFVGNGGSGSAPFGGRAFVANLNAAGTRAFFESTEALVSGDTNNKRDVYEWEQQGTGSCSRPGGCVYLISTGHSETDSYLFGHSASGDDAFFTTNEILAPGDQTTLSVYDARVGGGFPAPVSRACEGEGCRPSLSPPPGMAAPGKPATGVNDQVPRRSCPKGKHRVKRKGKSVCVKKHKKHHKAAKDKKGARR